jgi:hypothetical protein
VKLPPETPVMMSTSSISRRGFPPTVISVRRSSSSTPYENAAARVPPPENESTNSVCWSLFWRFGISR